MELAAGLQHYRESRWVKFKDSLPRRDHAASGHTRHAESAGGEVVDGGGDLLPEVSMAWPSGDAQTWKRISRV
jgi:hypothetical protein